MYKILIFFMVLYSFSFSSLIAKDTLERDNNLNIVVDNKNRLMWQDYDDDGLLVTWKKAKRHCENSNFSQFKDWRLPTIDELLSIVNYKKTKPAIKEQFKYTNYYWNPKENHSIYGTYWSSTNKTIIHTNSQHNTHTIYSIYFKDGISFLQTEFDYKTPIRSYVRCIRDIKKENR